MQKKSQQIKWRRQWGKTKPFSRVHVDKKKEGNKRACREKRQAHPFINVAGQEYYDFAVSR